MKVNKLRKLVPGLLLLAVLSACGPKEEPASSSAPPEERRAGDRFTIRSPPL